MNSSRGFKNIIFGMLAQVVTIGLGIIIPRLVLVNLGSEANGLLSSISSVLTYMSLLEAGVGTATLQALYEPIAKKDKTSINQVMAATHFFYRRTGTVYLAIVVLFAVGYSVIVDTSIPRMSVFLVVLLAGVSGVLNYYFQGKFKILLSAEGKTYITTNINTITTVGTSLLKAFVLIMGGEVVMVQSVYFIFNLIQMLFFAIYMKKNYRWLDLNVAPNFRAISQRNFVLIHQISGLIFSNTDVIILTLFTSLKTVSVYSMYAMIFGMVKAIAVTLSDGFVYALGQSYSDRKRFLKMFDAYEVFNLTFTSALFCIATILITPFLKLYTQGIEDISYIDSYLPILFCVFYLLHNGRASSANVINFAQHFKETRWRTILESTINLVSSIVLTWSLGIYGAVLGTILALLYRSNDMIIYAARLLERSSLVTYKRWVTNLLLCVVAFVICSLFDMKFDSYISLGVFGIVLSIAVFAVFMTTNFLFESEAVKYAFGVVKNRIRRNG